MRRVIGDHPYQLIDRVRDNEIARRGFLQLARAVFSLDFEPWLANGWWRGDYLPHVLMDGDRVAANVSVNFIHSRRQGEDKRYIQIGTVMTDREYRGWGLARHLMEEVIRRYAGTCDGMYLYANDSVKDFYPKFGFAPSQEYQYSLPVACSGMPVRKLDMDDLRDRALLMEAYIFRSNPHSALPMLENPGLLMFYCDQFLKAHIYEIPALHMVAVVEYHGENMLCYDVFGGYAPLREALNALAREETRTCVLGFTPMDASDCAVAPREEENTTLFVSGGLVSLFQENKIMFPLLSHA
jgi:GNAT superfamily N-acetyltransferase